MPSNVIALMAIFTQGRGRSREIRVTTIKSPIFKMFANKILIRGRLCVCINKLFFKLDLHGDTIIVCTVGHGIRSAYIFHSINDKVFCDTFWKILRRVKNGKELKLPG